MNSDWLTHVTPNHDALFQSRVITLLWNFYMKLAPGHVAHLQPKSLTAEIGTNNYGFFIS